jgi:hypothetical protein
MANTKKLFLRESFLRKQESKNKLSIISKRVVPAKAGIQKMLTDTIKVSYSERILAIIRDVDNPSTNGRILTSPPYSFTILYSGRSSAL